ncbi:hypothetical protein TNCV_2340311 [Trichonephila clavipes]|nr:hypothetical protein TNCV_2340311 [Trichonephila clavipes]
MRSACDQSTLPIDVQVFHCKARDPHVEAWRVECHLSCPPRHSTEVPNHTVYERRGRYRRQCAGHLAKPRHGAYLEYTQNIDLQYQGEDPMGKPDTPYLQH